MKKANVWEIVKNEAEYIIKAIEKGEFKTRKEYDEYLQSIYNWDVTFAIENIVSAYIGINHIEMAWGDETTETDD